MSIRAALATLALLTLAAFVRPAASQEAAQADTFDHWQHRKVFPRCETCHEGAAVAGAPLFPAAESCASCHDDDVERKVNWTPPGPEQPWLIRFSHPDHVEKVHERWRDSTLACGQCHFPEDGEWMRVKRRQVDPCLSCHEQKPSHFALADTACGMCHRPLAQATAVTRDEVADFPEPPSHKEDDFKLGRGHGRLARPSGAAGERFAVAPSCATCHARDFCITCHVNAPEVRAIQALQPDPRSLAIHAELEEPRNHKSPDFATSHGSIARRDRESCATCHTQQSCLTCHSGANAIIRSVPVAGPGRGPGPTLTRRRPASHGIDFAERHAPQASARPNTCSTCHTRESCLECHRPNAAQQAGYHPVDFLTRHPAAAYARQTNCADCHNTAVFCQECHAQAGLFATRTLGSGYHDGQRFFIAGHGQAARQSLESCVSCHAERDCLTCHSATGGRRFNPHGPGFDPARMKSKNPEMCSVCHGLAIP